MGGGDPQRHRDGGVLISEHHVGGDGVAQLVEQPRAVYLLGRWRILGRWLGGAGVVGRRLHAVGGRRLGAVIVARLPIALCAAAGYLTLEISFLHWSTSPLSARRSTAAASLRIRRGPTIRGGRGTRRVCGRGRTCRTRRSPCREPPSRRCS